MPQPMPIDDRIRVWSRQRRLVRASLTSSARGHVLSPRRGAPVRTRRAVAKPR